MACEDGGIKSTDVEEKQKEKIVCKMNREADAEEREGVLRKQLPGKGIKQKFY